MELFSSGHCVVLVVALAPLVPSLCPGLLLLLLVPHQHHILFGLATMMALSLQVEFSTHHPNLPLCFPSPLLPTYIVLAAIVGLSIFNSERTCGGVLP
jgi:hypothetical protein